MWAKGLKSKTITRFLPQKDKTIIFHIKQLLHLAAAMERNNFRSYNHQTICALHLTKT